jgi:hypothetical protein
MSKSHIRDQDEIEQRIRDLMDRLVEQMDIGWLKVTNAFDTGTEDRVICTTVCDWEYRQASFKWSLVQAATMTDADLQLAAVHELVHCLNASIWLSMSPKQQDRYAKLNELATENVARCISHLLSKGSA